MIRSLTLYFFLWLTTLVCHAQQISSALDSIHQLNPEDDYGNIHLYDSLLTHYKKTKNYTQLGSDAHQLAKWLVRENQLEKTIEVLKTGIAARKKAVPFNPDLLKRSYLNLGNYFKLKEDYNNCIQAYLDMISVKESTDLNEISYARLGHIYKRTEAHYKSVDAFNKAFKFYDPEKDRKKIIKNHIDIVGAYKDLRSYGYQEKDTITDKLLYHLLTADSILKTQQKPSLNDHFLVNLEIGLFYDNKKKFPKKEKTIFYFEKAFELAEKLDNSNYLAGVHVNLGQTYLSLENFEQSKNHFSKALQYSKNNRYNTFVSLLGVASIASEKENYEDAHKYYKKSLALLLNKTEYDQNWPPLFKNIQHSDYKEEILDIFRYSIIDYLKEAKQSKNKDLFDRVVQLVKSCDSIIDYTTNKNFSQLEKLRNKDISSEFYNMGLEASLYTNNLDDAFYLMEKSKAMLLMTDIYQKNRSLPTDIASKKTNYERRIQKLQNQLFLAVDSEKDSLTTTIKKIKKRYTRFIDSIEVIYPTYSNPIEAPKILPLSEVSVKENEVIIQYSMAERNAGALPHAYVMTLTKDTQKMLEIPEVDILIEDIKTLRKLLDQPFTTTEDITTYRKTSNDIYKSLFPEEIRAVLKGKKVTIIPDHMLGLIPFEALVTDPDNTKYLIEDCEIDYAFSLTFQQQNAKISRKAAQDFLGIAPVNFSQGLTALQNSNKEITAANAFYSGDLLVDQEATKENFIKKIKNYKILHLATHADASDSIAPWIAFRNSKLTDLELNSLQSQAELVVLSACNTSLGKISRGEGILSLARGFFKSGANTVIPSLWSTNDKATATITADFYKNLSEGQTKSAALRQAKLNYLHNNTDAEASPHYWASMILIGDTGTLLPQSNDLWMFLLGFGIIAAIALSLYVYKRITRV
ncbi:CHAT domain-containing protein [Aquimarina sp. 433]